VLGLILLGFQATLSSGQNKLSAARLSLCRCKSSKKQIQSRAFVGFLSLVAGVVVFATAQQSDEPDPSRAVK